MTAIDKEQRSIACFPDAHGLVAAGRGDPLPIGRPGDAIDRAAMALVGANWRSFRSVPGLRVVFSTKKSVANGRDDLCAIRRPGNRVHRVRVQQGKTLAGGLRVPDLHRSIIAGRGDAFAIWRPGDGIDCALMPVIEPDKVSAARIPDLHYPVLAAGGDVRAVRRPGDAAHGLRVVSIGQDVRAGDGVPDLDLVVALK